jgi:hypothetical protein
MLIESDEEKEEFLQSNGFQDQAHLFPLLLPRP